MSRKLLRNPLFISSALLFLVLFGVLYLNRRVSCTAIYDKDESYRFTFRGFTQESACRKAVAACTFYNSQRHLCHERI